MLGQGKEGHKFRKKESKKKGEERKESNAGTETYKPLGHSGRGITISEKKKRSESNIRAQKRFCSAHKYSRREERG